MAGLAEMLALTCAQVATRQSVMIATLPTTCSENTRVPTVSERRLIKPMWHMFETLVVVERK